MTAREYLEQVKLARKEVRYWESVVLNLEQDATGLCGINYEDRRVIGSGSFGNRYDDIAQQLDRAQKKLEDARQWFAAVVGWVSRVIEAVPDADQKLLLQLRDVSCLQWQEVCCEMGYSERSVYYLHKRAIQSIGELPGNLK